MSNKTRIAAIAAASSMVACALGALGPTGGAEAPGLPALLGDPEVSPTRKLDIVPARVPGAVFVREGKPYCFAGANSVALSYESEEAVSSIIGQAKEMGLKVLRTYAFIDRGSLDGRVESVDGNGTKNGVYFQYWDTAKQRVVYNDGPTGLQHLDFAVAEAKRQGLQLALVLTNNWSNFGGMEQYLRWFNLKSHSQFFTDNRARRAYQNYATHLLERVNSITGVAYKDEPAIFSWELANDPRCSNGGRLEPQSYCDVRALTRWADEMSQHLHQVDPNHLVAVGDAGFFSQDDNAKWPYNGSIGVDHASLLALPGVDFGTFQLFPDQWRTTYGWGNTWIAEHIATARAAGKPTVLSEYGIALSSVIGAEQAGRDRQIVYDNWNRSLLLGGGNAALVWQLGGGSSAVASAVSRRDGFEIYSSPGDPVAELLTDLAQKYTERARVCDLASDWELSNESNGGFVTTARAPKAAGPRPTPSAH